MPVMGPDYSKERADQAVEDIIKLLADKYKINKFPTNDLGIGLIDYDTLRAEDKEKLRAAVHDMFLHDCWEGW
jgi:hypothetical protein